MSSQQWSGLTFWFAGRIFASRHIPTIIKFRSYCDTNHCWSFSSNSGHPTLGSSIRSASSCKCKYHEWFMSLFQHFFTRVVGIRGSDPTGLNNFVFWINPSWSICGIPDTSKQKSYRILPGAWKFTHVAMHPKCCDLWSGKISGCSLKFDIFWWVLTFLHKDLLWFLYRMASFFLQFPAAFCCPSAAATEEALHSFSPQDSAGGTFLATSQDAVAATRFSKDRGSAN